MDQSLIGMLSRFYMNLRWRGEIYLVAEPDACVAIKLDVKAIGTEERMEIRV
jgi:hypothetical protein